MDYGWRTEDGSGVCPFGAKGAIHGADVFRSKCNRPWEFESVGCKDQPRDGVYINSPGVQRFGVHYDLDQH